MLGRGNPKSLRSRGFGADLRSVKRNGEELEDGLESSAFRVFFLDFSSPLSHRHLLLKCHLLSLPVMVNVTFVLAAVAGYQKDVSVLLDITGFPVTMIKTG